MGIAQAGHFLALAAQAYSAGRYDVGQTLLTQSVEDIDKAQPYASILLVFRPVAAVL
jgi:hypothetical protein